MDNREKVKLEELGKEVEYIVSPITTTHPYQTEEGSEKEDADMQVIGSNPT